MFLFVKANIFINTCLTIAQFSFVYNKTFVIENAKQIVNILLRKCKTLFSKEAQRRAKPTAGAERKRVGLSAVLGSGSASKQCSELFDGKTGIFHNTTHRKCLDRVMARNSYKTLSITHNDVFTLSDYSKAPFLKSTYCIKMIDAWQLRHSYAATSIS